MFDFLQQIDLRVYERYLTLERNIKSGANSFYDAYLDLQEQFVRFVLVEMGLDATARETCGALLKRPDAIKAFHSLGVDERTYAKMEDYALKVNAHKHKGEKRIQVDTILNYMRIFYEVSTCYAKHVGVPFDDFDANCILSIFGIFEKENAALQQQLETVKSELDELAQQKRLREEDMAIYRTIIQRTELGTMSFEEQNRELREQLSRLKDIINNNLSEKVDKLEEGQQEILEMLQKMQQGANASSQGARSNTNPYQAQMQRTNQQATIRNFMRRAIKSYRYMTDWKTFEADKKLSLLLALVLFGLGIVMIPVVSVAAGLYTTFTFIENIWLIFVLTVLFQIKRAKPLYECFEFSTHCFMKFEMDGDGTMRKGLFMKKRYRVFQVLACISAVCNTIYVWGEGKIALAIFATLFEIAFFVLTILVLYKADEFFMMYAAIYYTADNDKRTQRVTVVYNELDGKLYTKEDFEKRFPHCK